MIHNISMATVYDVITLSDDVSIYSFIQGNCHFEHCFSWLKEMQSFQAMTFLTYLFFVLGTHLWPLSVLSPVTDNCPS